MRRETSFERERLASCTCAQQVPKAPGKIPSREQASSASKDTMIAALQKRVREQAAEIEQLQRQVEVAYGLLAAQRGESREGTV